MRLAFIDLGDLDYCARTPLTQPLGGTESALVYLCAALAARGHEVAVFNRTSEPGEYDGVSYRNRTAADAWKRANGCDLAVVSGVADGLSLRRAGVRVPLILWSGHLPSFPLVRNLANPDEIVAWTAFAFVSEWQRGGFVRRFALDAGKTAVLRNAIAPVFAKEPVRPAWFESGGGPTLVYTSTPFRGLSVLLAAFPRIRAAVGDATLRIFSGMSTYQAPDQDAAFADLYRHAQTLPGVDHVGPVSQAALARELAGAAALAYPSIYAETSCIAAMEALSAGSPVLATRFGALEETVGRFGRFVDVSTNARELVSRYADMVVSALLETRREPRAAAERRAEQIREVRQRWIWPERAREWNDWLATLPIG